MAADAEIHDVTAPPATATRSATLVEHLRASARLVAFLTYSTVLYLMWAVSHVLALVSRPLMVRVQTALVRAWGRGVAAILGLRITVDGEPPEPPFLLVSNHLSYVDIVTLMSQMPAVFVAKSEVAGWPFLGRLSRAANTIFVDRARRADVVRVNELIGAVLDSGRGLVMFPEGTSSRGHEVLPFRTSLLEPAIRIGHPVSYAALSYRTPAGSPPASTSVCWWGDMTFLGHFYGLLMLPSFSARLVFGAEPVRAENRRDLADRLRAAVARQFAPLRDPEARWA